MGATEVNEEYKLTKKANNGIVYSYYWYVGYKFAKLFKFIGFSPNLVSWFSLLFYIISAVLFLKGNYIFNILGGISFYLGIQMDATDGKLARMTNTTSKMGIWLDYNFDYLKPFFIYPPIAIALFTKDNNIYWIILAFIALTSIYIFTIISMRWDMFDFSNQVKDDYVKKSKYHRYLKQFYFYEGIEPIVAILFACFGIIEYYLITWTAGLFIMYLGSTFIWGMVIYKKDILTKQNNLNRKSD